MKDGFFFLAAPVHMAEADGVPAIAFHRQEFIQEEHQRVL